MDSCIQITEKNIDFKKKFFKEKKDIDLCKIQITTDGVYSITCLEASKLLSGIIKKWFGTSNIVITDGTGNNGADTIMLAHKFKKINSIEINKINFYVLTNNVKNVYNLNNVCLYNGNCIDIIPTLNQDVIYVDPPWGGPHYYKEKNLKLFLGKYELYDFVKKFYNYTKLFVLKVPINYNLFGFEQCYKIPYIEKNKIKYYFILIDTL